MASPETLGLRWCPTVLLQVGLENSVDGQPFHKRR